jgi:RNA polymerase sigma-70 factor (family 1)
MNLDCMSFVKPNESGTSVFEQLFNEHYSWLAYCAAKITKDLDIARDLVQDFFVYYWNHRANITITGSFKSYATRAVMNIAIAYTKKDKIRAHHYAQFFREEWGKDADNESTGPEQEAQIDRILHAINKLPCQRKEALMLHYFENLKYTEIADKMGITKNTVKTHLRLAYKILRKNLES